MLALAAMPGCLGGDEEETGRIEGDTVTIYSSLPRGGVSAPVARAVAAGERLALEQAGARVAGLRVRVVRLDASEPGERLWSPERVNANAERAADDPTAIAYLGELSYGASAVSVPVTNEAGIVQVSPADGLTSLTQSPPGRPRAGPDRYYPSDEHSFLRLVPADVIQAEVLLEHVRATGARRMAVLSDQEIYGRELGGQLVALGRRDGPEPVSVEEYRGNVEEIPDLVRSLSEGRPDAVVYAGVAGPGSGRLLAGLDAALPGVPVYVTSGMLARHPLPRISDAPAIVEALGPFPPVTELPAPARVVLRRVRDRFGAAAARCEALYGYEAMRLVLDAIRVGGPDREQVRSEALRIRERHSPLGTYEVRRTGDVAEESFALYALRDGRFTFEQMLE